MIECLSFERHGALKRSQRLSSALRKLHPFFLAKHLYRQLDLTSRELFFSFAPLMALLNDFLRRARLANSDDPMHGGEQFEPKGGFKALG